MLVSYNKSSLSLKDVTPIINNINGKIQTWCPNILISRLTVVSREAKKKQPYATNE